MIDAPIEHIQHVLEDKLTKMPSTIHRFNSHDVEYWYYIGKYEAYEEIRNYIKSLEGHFELLQ